MSGLEGWALVEAERHQPEKGGGCICGFCVYSVDHVVVMSIRHAEEQNVRSVTPVNGGLTPVEASAVSGNTPSPTSEETKK